MFVKFMNGYAGKGRKKVSGRGGIDLIMNILLTAK